MPTDAEWGRMPDAERHALMAQSLDQGQEPRQFVFQPHRLCARPGRLAANIQQIRPFGKQLPGMGNARIERKIQAAIGKRVWRDVDDPHDQGPRQIQGKTTT